MTLKTENIPIKHRWDIWVAVTSLAVILMAAWRLWATGWTGNLYILVYLMFFAGVTGLALGYSRFSPLLSGLFSLLYGIFFTGWLFGTTVEIEMTWRDRILNYLGWRLRIAIEQYRAGDALTDPILFLFIMAGLLWVMGSTAAFLLARQREIWPTLIPLGFVILLIGHYDQDLTRNTRFLIVFLFFSFLLLSRMTFLQYKQKWQQEGIHITDETQLDITKALLITVTVLLIIIWMIPITPQQANRYSELWDKLTDPWDRLQDQLSGLFVVENPTIYSTTSYYGESMRLGVGASVSEEVIFRVSLDDSTPSGWRNYWRARSYDSYRENEWANGSGLSQINFFPETFEIRYPDWESGQLTTYTFTNTLSQMINLYTTGNPVWVSWPVEATLHSMSEAGEDLVSLIADPAVGREQTYKIETRISVPTISQLRSSNTDYPTWLDRYLQLPANFPSNIRGLAQEIAQSYNNPYDQAYAITHYLRNQIEYSRTMPPIPEGSDPIEWFLFEGKIGFCNYYATAEVLMLRSLGIPARMGVGYAQGEFDAINNTFIVRKRDSHAWPEVYFVGYGWVIFEPTVSQPPLIRPEGEQTTPESTSPVIEGEEQPLIFPPMDNEILMDEMPESSLAEQYQINDQPVIRVEGSRIIWGILILFLIILIVAVLILLRPTYFKLNIDPLPVILETTLRKKGKSVPVWLRRWSYYAQMSAAERAYRQLGRALRILGHPGNPSETPAERAQILAKLLPAAASPVSDILSEYHLDQFSNHIINEEKAKSAARKVRSLAVKAYFQNLFKFLSRGN